MKAVHELTFHRDIIGVSGYDSKDVFALIANDDNHYLIHGIAQNSLVVVDPKLPYKKGKLSVFFDPTKKPQMRISQKKLSGCSYRGRVLFSLNVYA